MVATRVYGLDDDLGIWAIVWADGRSNASGGGKDGRREGDGVEIRALGYRGILEDNQETGVVLPLDFKAAIHALVVGERGLDVLGLEFLGEPGEVENAGDGG